MWKLAWRFASGLHMDGEQRMNISWARNGTVPRWKDNWWNRKSRFRKMAWRWGVLLSLIIEVWFLLVFLVPALIVTGALALWAAEKALRAVWGVLRNEAPRRVAVEERDSDERSMIDNIGAVEMSGDIAPAPQPQPVDPRKVGGKVLGNNPFITVTPIAREEEAG